MAAEKLIFPGVGAFEQAMGVLRSKAYTEPLKDYIQVEFPRNFLDGTNQDVRSRNWRNALHLMQQLP